MKSPKGSDGWYDRFCRSLYAQYEKPWVQYAVAPALVAVPPWIVNKLLDSAAAKLWIRGALPAIAGVPEQYDVVFYALAAFYSWAILKVNFSASPVTEPQHGGDPDA